MTKYLLGSLILSLASAVQADLCDSQWWQIEAGVANPWQPVKDIIESEGFDADARCNEIQDRPLHVALKIPEPMSIESYYAIGTFVETVPFLIDISFLYSSNRSGQTPYTLARRRYENMLERINRDINRDDPSQMARIAEREAPEYRLYSSIMMRFAGGESLVREAMDDLERIDFTFFVLMINEVNKGLTFEDSSMSIALSMPTIEEKDIIGEGNSHASLIPFESYRSLIPLMPDESNRALFEEYIDFAQEAVLSDNTFCQIQLLNDPMFNSLILLLNDSFSYDEAYGEGIQRLFNSVKENWNTCIN